MKILIFTDLHGQLSSLKKIKKKAKEVDLIINCGDFTIFEHEMEFLLDEFEKIGKPMLILHGNHEDEDYLEELCLLYNNLIFMHKRVYVKDGLTVMGHGGGGFTKFDKDFVQFTENTMKKFTKEQKEKFILMVHQPPFKTVLDKLSVGDVGNKDYTDFIKKYQPLYSISGHIHDNEGKQQKIGKTIVINPGPDGQIIEI